MLVIGTGNSGHDIAQDLYSNGAKVTVVQRSPTLIVNIEPSAQLPYALYSEGTPLEDCDLITASMPLSLMRQTHRVLTERARILDQQLLDDLTRVGFKVDVEDETGWQFKYLQRGGEVVPADLVVLATGYKGQEYLVRRLFGDGVADRVGPIWGIDEEAQELRNMWMRTGQSGLWFIAGSFAQCRIYSKYLALQLKAAEEGLAGA